MIFCAALNFADLDLGLLPISAGPGAMGFLVNIFIDPFASSSFKNIFAILSSNEWKDITASLPPGASISNACGNALLKFSSS